VQRWEFCQAVQQLAPRSFAALCRRFGISRRTGYKWRRRAPEALWHGWEDRSRRPHAGSRLAPRWQPVVLAARRAHPQWGARKLRWLIRQDHRYVRVPAVRTLHRWLQQAGVVPRRRRLPPGPWRRAPSAILARRPNDVWTLDFKGPFRTADGTRIDALTVRDAASHCLLAVTRVRCLSEAAVKAACQRIFRRYGRPRSLLMDRGAPWCGLGPYGWTRLSVWWLRLGIEPRFTRRARPQDNAAHEQMHRMLKAATAKPPAPTARAQVQRFVRWRRHYNYARPHASLGERPPAHVYRASPRRYPVALLTWSYPAHWNQVRVTRSGTIRWHGQLYSVGRAFHGALLGLRGETTVYLGPH
jgi:putative transposase